MAHRAQKSVFFGVLFWIGCALIVTSIVWRQADHGSSSWTDTQAVDYAAAAKEYHALSYRKPSPQQQRELQAAQMRYEQLRTQLDGARDRGNRIAKLLRWSGLLSTVLGLAGYLTYRAEAGG